MKRIIISIIMISFIFIITGAPNSYAQTSFTLNAQTGDANLDLTLKNINIEAQESIPGFVSNVSLCYGVPKAKIEDLIFNGKMSPADVYMTIGIAKIIKKPIETVAEEYKINKSKGWGKIAKNLGIKPGSKAFHELKKGGIIELEKMKGKSKGKGKGKKKSYEVKKKKKK